MSTPLKNMTPPHPQPLTLDIPQGIGGLREPLPHLQWNIDKPEGSLFTVPPSVPT